MLMWPTEKEMLLWRTGKDSLLWLAEKYYEISRKGGGVTDS